MLLIKERHSKEWRSLFVIDDDDLQIALHYYSGGDDFSKRNARKHFKEVLRGCIGVLPLL